jgi:predicted Zn-dependent protease with MMP-like domain
LLKYDAYMHQGDREGARRVVHSFPDGPFENARLDFLVGRAHFETGGLVQAKTLLEHAIAAEPAFGDAHHTLALVYEAQGDNAATVRSFLRAREADMLLGAPSWALSSSAFEELARTAIKKLAPQLQAAVQNAELFISDMPGAEVVADGVDPRISALLDAGERSAGASVPAGDQEPNVRRIFFYQRNIERSVEDASELPDEVAVVLEEELTAIFPALAPYATLMRAEDEHSGSDH